MKESQNFYANYITKFSINLDGNLDLYAGETCWCDEALTHFISSIHCFMPCVCHFSKKNLNIVLYSDTYRPISFRPIMMIEITKFTF